MGKPATLTGTLNVYAGDNASFLIEVFADTALTIPADLTGSTFTAQWRQTRASSTAVDLVVTSTDLTNGQVTLVVDAAASNAIVAGTTADAIRGVFDISGLAAGVSTTYLTGYLAVTRDVTRA